MNVRINAKFTQLLDSLVIQSWKSAYQKAAVYRLGLARRFKDHYLSLDGEFVNFSGCFSWLALQEDDATAGLLVEYVEVLAPYLRYRGLNAILRQWCQAAIPVCIRLGQRPNRLYLLQGEAWNALGEWKMALVDIQQAIQLSLGGDPETFARATLALGRLQLNQGEYELSLKTLRQAERLLEEAEDYPSLATARSEIAAYHLNRNELDAALVIYHQVEQFLKETGSPASDHNLMMLGVTYRRKRNFPKAQFYLCRLLEAGESQHNRSAVAVASHHLAWVYLNVGDIAQAERLCKRSLALYDDLGDPRGMSDAYEQLGMIALAHQRYRDALISLEKSLELRQRMGNQHGVASSLRHLALAQFRNRDWVSAACYLTKSLRMYRELGLLTRSRFISAVALAAEGQPITQART